MVNGELREILDFGFWIEEQTIVESADFSWGVSSQFRILVSRFDGRNLGI